MELFEITENILNDRQASYGNSNKMLYTIAEYWTTYLQQQYCDDRPIKKDEITFSPGDVAMMMILLKLAREGYQPQRDNRIDIIGYTKILDDNMLEPAVNRA